MEAIMETQDDGKPSVGVIIVAAGSSKRMEGVDKIFMTVAGKSVLEWTTSAFEASGSVNDIAIVLPADKIREGKALVEKNNWKKVRAVCAGGERRQDSVRNGMQHLAHCDYIMVHDGARPCVSERIIRDGLENAIKFGAAVPGVKVSDTIKRIDASGLISSHVDREGLSAIQTPQVFKTAILADAYKELKDNVTDDSSVVQTLGYPVRVFDGALDNIKITTKTDIDRVAYLLGKNSSSTKKL
jgi:2-C-methyl-D-erythritol 4-phosphate cytidylyltransferase